MAKARFNDGRDKISKAVPETYFNMYNRNSNSIINKYLCLTFKYIKCLQNNYTLSNSFIHSNSNFSILNAKLNNKLFLSYVSS